MLCEMATRRPRGNSPDAQRQALAPCRVATGLPVGWHPRCRASTEPGGRAGAARGMGAGARARTACARAAYPCLLQCIMAIP